MTPASRHKVRRCPQLIAGLIGLICALPAPLLGQVGTDVMIPDEAARRQAQARTKMATARFIRDEGEFAIMELTGNYDRDLPTGELNLGPRTAVAEAFYANHDDEYDFLVVFTSFEFATPGAVAFYVTVFNDIEGIGQNLFDNRDVFGQSNRLQGYIDMAAYSRYELDSLEPDFDFTLDTMVHEVMHRWGVFINYRNAANQTDDGILGYQGAHWGHYVDSNASVMGGGDWRDNGDGSFTALNVRHRYGDVDLYNAGMLPADQVDDFFVIRDADGDPLQFIPQIGDTTGGNAEPISIDQVIAEEGPRDPGFDASQKEFRAGFILLVAPGQFPSDELLASLNDARRGMADRFNAETRGLGVIKTRLAQSSGLGVAGPSTVSGAPPANGLADFAAAVDWLLAAQSPAGSWQDKPGTAVRDTALALAALESLQINDPALVLGRNWIGSQQPDSIDETAWLLSSGASGAATQALLAKLGDAQNGDGGWGLGDQLASSPYDTALVLSRVRDPGAGALLGGAGGFLLASRRPGSGWGALENGGNQIATTALALDGLVRNSVGAAELSEAFAWLGSTQRPGGGFGEGNGSPHETALAMNALGLSPATPAVALDQAGTALEGMQGGDGSWSGSVYSTSLALLALRNRQNPNLSIAAPPTIDPLAPRDGDIVEIAFTVANTGLFNTPPVTARAYSGDPNAGGAPLGAPVAVPALAAGESFPVTIPWDTFDQAGIVPVLVWADTDEVVTESAESDNFASVEVTVDPPPTQADVAVLANTLNFSPTVVGSLPVDFQADVGVRNLSTSALNGVTVALQRKTPGGGFNTLHTQQADFAARQTRALSFPTPITEPGLIELRIIADPDDLIAEPNEQDNEIGFSVPTADALDLAVLPAEMQLLTATPMAGQDVAFRVVVRNQGTVDAPPARFEALVEFGGESHPLLSETVQLNAGAASQRDLVWRAPGAGSARLVVSIDPLNVIVEGDEGNNQGTLDFSVAAVAAPNLAVDFEDLVFTPDPALEGQSLNVSIPVSNSSANDAGAFDVEFFEGVPDDGGTLVETVAVAGLAAGARVDIAIDTAPLVGGGERLFYVAVDRLDAVAEFDEDDNNAFDVVDVLRLPDLAITPASVVLAPSQPVPGAAVSATVAVDNLGQQDAADVTVALYELSAAGQTLVAPAQTIAAVAANSSAMVMFDWSFGAAGAGVDELRVVVDEADQVFEISNDNNSATVRVDLQNQDFFTSERYISPNGDGVKDSTGIGYRLPSPQTIGVVIEDSNADTVRRFDLTNVERGEVIWDGRNDRGSLVRDGPYQVKLLDADDALLGQTLVIVDTNRLPTLNAAGTPAAYFTDLRCSIEFASVASFSVDGRYVYSTSLRDLNGDFRSGLFRIPTRGRGLDQLLRDEFLAQLTGGTSIQDVTALPDGRVLFSNGAGCGNCARGLWIKPTPLAAPVQIDTANSAQFDVYHVGPEYALIEDLAPDQWYKVFYQPGVPAQPLNMPDSNMGFSRAVAGGWLMSRFESRDFNGFSQFGQALWFVSADPGVAPTFVTFGPRLQIATSADGRYFATVATDDPFDVEPPGLGVVRAGRIDAQAAEVYFDQTVSLGQAWDLQVSLSPNNELLVADGTTASIELFDPSGLPIGEIRFPTDLMDDYIATVPPEDFRDKGTPAGEGGGGTPLPPITVFVNLGGPVVYSSDTNEIMVQLALVYPNSFGERKSGSQPGLKRAPSGTQFSQLYRVGLDDREPILIGTINDEADDEIIFPQQLDLSDPSVLSWLSREDRLLIDRNSLNPIALDMRPEVQIDDGLGLGRLQRAWPAGFGAMARRYYVDFFTGPDEFKCPGSGSPVLFFESADNLIAHLEVARFASVIELNGVASDRYLQSYQLDWAYADEPDTWFTLSSASGDTIIDDLLASWVPPDAGSFLVRLRVMDRAGNMAEDVRSLSWLDPASLADVRVEPRYISPNGDGIQDAATLSFRVLEPLNLDVTIENDNGQVLRVLSGQYPTVTGATESLLWDGRDDLGRMVPEGVYLMRVQNRRFRIVVDITPPNLSLSLPRAYQREAVDGSPDLVDVRHRIRAGLHELNLDEAVIEFRRGNQPWNEFELFTFVPDDQPIMRPVPRDLFVTAEFRFSAEDRAGNRAQTQAANLFDDLILTDVRQFYLVPTLDVSEPPEKKIDRGRLPYINPPFPSAEFPDVLVPVVSDRLAMEVELTFANAFDQFFIELADPATPDSWISLPKEPAPATTEENFESSQEVSSPFRHLFLLPLSELLGLEDVLVRIRGDIGSTSFFSNGMRLGLDPGLRMSTIRRAIIEILRGTLEPEQDVDLVLALRDLVPSKDTTITQFWVRESLVGLPDNTRLLVASDDDARYFNTTAFLPVTETRLLPPSEFSAEMFEVPTAPCRNYDVTWEADFPNGVGGTRPVSFPEPFKFKRSCLEIQATRFAVPGLFCAESSVEEIELQVVLTTDDPDILPTTLDIFDVGANGQEILVANVVAPRINQVYPLTIDASLLTEGQRALTIRVVDSVGDRVERRVLLPVDRQAPEVSLDFPANGERLCAIQDDDGAIQFPLEGVIEDDFEFVYKALLGSGHDAPDLKLIGGSPNSIMVGEQKISCSLDFAGIIHERCFDNSSSAFGELGLYDFPDTHEFELTTGPTTGVIEAMDWSGRRYCSISRFDLDASVDAGVVGEFGLLSPNGDGAFDTAQIAVQALEPLTMSVSLYAAARSSQGWFVTGDPIAQLVSGAAVEGDLTFDWGGDDGTNVLPDGRYGLRFEFVDNCGLSATLDSFGEIDLTPPDVILDYPLSGDPVGAIVEVLGGFTDRNFSLATVSYGVDDALITLETHTGEVPPSDVIATWVLAGLAPQTYNLRVFARDAAFNEAEIVVPIDIVAITSLIWALEAEPPLFSPNDDGVQDSTDVRLGVQDTGLFTLRVQTPGGTTVRSLGSDLTLNAGTENFAWDGTNDAGSVVADGDYLVVVDAGDTGGSGFNQTEQITVTVDTTPPTLQLLNPQDPVVKGTGSFVFDANDPHFLYLRAWNTPLDPPAPQVQLLDRALTGMVTTGDLSDLEEGPQLLRLEAADRAGNVSEIEHQYVIDNTPPEVTLTSPQAGALLGGEQSTMTITGEVSDANFAGYALAVRPAGTMDPWFDIAGDTVIPPDEVLAEWPINVPDGAYDLRLLATDQAGWETFVVIDVVIDTTAPTAILTAPLDDALVNLGTQITGTATDDNFKQYRLRIADAAGSPIWSDIGIKDLQVTDGLLLDWNSLPPDGRYRLQLLVEDEVGLTGTAEVLVQVDQTPPQPPSNLRAETQPGFNVQLDWDPGSGDDLAGYRIRRGGAVLNPTPVVSVTYLDPDVPEGEHSYFVVAVDEAGNESEPTNTVTVTIDRTPPDVVLIEPAEGERVRGTVDIVGTASSADDFFEYRLYVRQQGDAAPGDLIIRSPSAVIGERLASWDSTTVAQEQTYVFLLEGEDTSGNVATSERSVIVDNLAPAAPLNLTAVLQGQTDAQTDWNANVEADLAGYLLFRDGQLVNAPGDAGEDLRPFALPDTSYLDPGLSDGLHQYQVFAIDLAANVSAPSNTAEVTVETGPPDLTIVEPEDGARFEAPLFILATSDDLDVASVQFQYRAAGAAAWLDLGAALLEVPYQTTLDPEALGLSFGDFEIRGVATDDGGLTDPTPSVVNVTYADLTAPDPALDLTAGVNGGDVTLNWQASPSDDVDEYLIYRGDDIDPIEEYDSVDAASTTYVDVNLADGQYQYFVIAADAEFNESVASNTVDALVHTPAFAHPFTPTRDPDFSVQGQSLVAGTVSGQLDNVAGATPVGPIATAADGAFGVGPLALAEGVNTLSFTVTDSLGNLSKPGLAVMQKGMDPAAPTNPAVVVTDFDVDFGWDASPESNVVGYRPFRNGDPRLTDAIVTSGLGYTASSNAGQASRVGDTSIFTYWRPLDSDLRDGPPTWIEVNLSAPRLLSGVELDWYFGRRPFNYSVEVWSGFVWLQIAAVDELTSDLQRLDFTEPYRTDRVRVMIGDYDPNRFWPVRLDTLRLMERPLVSPPNYTDLSVPDGIHLYQVTAVNDYGFESPLSVVATAEVGDVEPPPPVVLSGSVTGADASLSWTESAAPDLAEYRLFRDGAPILLRTDIVNRDYVDAGLMNGTYDYFVVAVDATGNVGDPSNTVPLTIAVDSVEAPQNLTVTVPNRGGALDLAWQPGGGVPPTAYRIKRALAAGGPYDFVAETDATTYQDTGLSNGVTYFYVVHALDALNNESGPSNEASGTPQDIVAPAAPELFFPTVPGVPVTIDALSTDVAGTAEPGVEVELARNGSIVGTTRASEEFTVETLFTDRFVFGSLISPDGRHLLIDDFPDQLFDTETLQSRPMPFAFSTSTWAPDGKSLFVVADDFFGELREYGLDGQLLDVIHDWVDVQFGAGSPDGNLVFAAGTTETTMKGTGVDGVWLVDRDGGMVTRVGAVASSEVDPTGVRFSHDGSKIAFLRFAPFTSLGDLVVYDIASGQLQTLSSTARLYPPAWSHDDTRLAFTGEGLTQDQIFIAELASGAVSPISDGNNPYERSEWSPDDRYLAFVDRCCEILISEVASGTVVYQEFTPSIGDIRWLNNGRLFLQHFDQFSLIEPPGYFVLDDMALAAGDNEVIATAFDDGANISLPSAPILIQVPAEGFPDLAILSSDLGVLPAGGAPGDAFQVNLLVRNLGLEAAPPAQVSLLLLSPDGTSEELVADQGPVSLAGGGQQAFSVAIGPLDLEGVYRLVAFIDPGNQIAEVNETNNLAEVSFRVTAATLPTLTLMTDRAEFPPDQPITGMAEIYNPGAPFSGRVQITAEDASGFALDFSQATEIRELDFATSLTVPIAWNAGTLFSGIYRLRAVLFDDSGTEIRRASVEFRIGRVAEFALTLSSPQTQYAQDEQAPFAAELRFLEGNVVIQDAVLRWRAIAPDGGVVWTDTTPLGAMLQGFRSVLNQTWPVGPATLGVYRVRAELESADAFAEAELLVNVVAPQQTAAITGTLSVDSPVVAIGRAFDVAYAVENSGSVAASNLPISLRLLRSGGLNQILGRDSTVDLAVGQRADLAVTWDSSVLGFDSYLIVLSADLTSLGGAADVVLDSASISGIDATPPELDVLSPADGAITNADVLLAAESFDQLSAVESVTVRFDGGDPQAMGIASEAVVYQRWLFDLPEGPHDFQVRSADTWSNEVESIPRTFTVDRTAPLIGISGVNDGDLLNIPVQPVITVTDLHLDQVISRLNGTDFVSGTTLAGDGDYSLSVSANDLAGNEAERRIGFVLDFTPPLVTVNFPADGAELSIPTTAVTGTTEAGALVDIRVGAFSAQTVSSAAGQFDFQGVPLTQGANTLALDARDPAGNRGPETSLVVTFTVPTADLLGAITPPPSPHPIGQPLSVDYSISNSGNADAAALPVRLNLINSASGLSIASAATTIDVAAGATVPGNAQFDTQALALGGYRLDLEADQGGFVLLDTAAVTLADQGPPQISPVQPAAGSVHPPTLDIAALVTDQRSPIDRVEYLLDSNPAAPLNLADAATGEYRSTAAGLSHGAHSVSFRAADVPGNEAMTSVIAFEVDALPPAIVIAGVDPGGLYNAAVTPTITVTDDNLDQVTTTLDGLDFASGTPVTLEGPHVLQVSASDVVGNDNTLAVAFELDLTPPVVTVASPADGARIVGTSTDLTGSTETNATVTLTHGAYTDTQAADGGGQFDFSAVPIALGDNSITLNAVDRAGNRGPDASLNVIGLEGALIVGELQLSSDQLPAGETLTVPYRLRNDGDVALSQLPTRVAAYLLGSNKGAPGTLIGSTQTTHDMPAGGEVNFALELNTDGWVPGSYAITLEVDLPEDPAGQWTSLASSDLALTGASLSLTVVFPADRAMIAADRTDVYGDTAAGATVTLFKPGFSATAVADASGRYLFSAVPIQRGANALTLVADNGTLTSEPVTLTLFGPAAPIPGLGAGGMLLLVLLIAALGATALWAKGGRQKRTVNA